jgi:hypothetical protein
MPESGESDAPKEWPVASGLWSEEGSWPLTTGIGGGQP